MPASIISRSIRKARALDIGASTGGLRRSCSNAARRVTALDVGHGQLDRTLRDDLRVTVIEGLNARDLTLADLGDVSPDFLVSDVSFISLTLALPPAWRSPRPARRASSW